MPDFYFQYVKNIEKPTFNTVFKKGAQVYCETTQFLISHNKEDRIKNIEELLNSIIESEKQNPGISLSEYLDMISLTTTTDNLEETENFVKLMTVHSSKGLEFDYVYLAGMEDGLFPSCNFETTEDEIEEERRLCYVAVTRAKKEL